MSSGVTDQVGLKPAAQRQKLAKTTDIALFRQRTTKALIKLRGCAGWYAPLLFAYDIRHVFSWPGSIGFYYPHIIGPLTFQSTKRHVNLLMLNMINNIKCISLFWLIQSYIKCDYLLIISWSLSCGLIIWASSWETLSSGFSTRSD